MLSYTSTILACRALQLYHNPLSGLDLHARHLHVARIIIGLSLLFSDRTLFDIIGLLLVKINAHKYVNRVPGICKLLNSLRILQCDSRVISMLRSKYASQAHKPSHFVFYKKTKL